MRKGTFGLAALWLVAMGCSSSPQSDDKPQPAFCQNALQTCFEFCLCATGEADRCFDACEESGTGGDPGVGGGTGTGGDPGGGGSAGSAGGAGTGGAPAGGGAGTGGAPAGGGGGTPGGGGGTSGPSCAGSCGSTKAVAGSCYCDSDCQKYGDCCPDWAAVCGGGSGGATGSGGSTGNSCGSWPAGPAGVAQNSTLPQSLSWQGYREGSSAVSSVSIGDYYDCDGKKGVNALMIITGTPNCGACKSEASTLEAKMAAWGGMGIKVITLMVGSVSTAEAWKNKYGLNKSAVLADKMPPSMAYSSSIGTPMHHIVDPRTMKVVYTQMGAGGSAFSQLEQLAAKNKK